MTTDKNGVPYLTEEELTELKIIGSNYLYLGVDDEGAISVNGIYEILKRYEQMRREKTSTPTS
jgi:hypothetical protein